MKKLILVALLGLGTAHAQEQLIDKIVGVVNTRVYSLSELRRVIQTLPARQEISPFLYTKATYSEADILELMIKTYIMRDKLGAQGYVIGDDAVESRIQMTEEKLGLSRDSLLEFLRSKGVTYEEYFEVIREAMEYNLFSSRIIGPLVSLTEQELKNEFYRRFSDNKAVSFTYNLVDFSVELNEVARKEPEIFASALKEYQISGRLGYGFNDLDANVLDDMKEDGLAPAIAKSLSQTPEGGFSPAVVIGGRLHSFYVKSKELNESQAYLQAKARLEDELFAKKSAALMDNWFDREFANYFIKKSL